MAAGDTGPEAATQHDRMVARARAWIYRHDPVLQMGAFPALHADMLAHYDALRIQQILLQQAIARTASPLPLHP